MESLVNPLIINNSIMSGSNDKKSDAFSIMNSNSELSIVEKVMVKLKLSTKQQGDLEWFFRFISPFLAMSISVFINFFIIPHEYSLWKGLLGFLSFPMILYLFKQQKHRISHICGYENSYYLGFFLTGMVHNYFTYFVYINKCKLNNFQIQILDDSYI